MDVLVWLTETTWPACVRAALDLVAPDARITLLLVVDDEVGAAASGAFAGLLGRSGRGRDPGHEVQELAERAGRELLAVAADQIGRDVDTRLRRGRVEREVVAALSEADAGLLVVARDGDLRRVGPHSLSPPTRFVVDHAPCATLLVWPEGAPQSDALPPAPKPGKSPGPGRGDPPPTPGLGGPRPPRHHQGPPVQGTQVRPSDRDDPAIGATPVEAPPRGVSP